MKRPLIPAFLKKFDQQLLLNKPDSWSARTHLVVWYSILFCIAIGIFAFVSFTDPRLRSQSEVPVIFTFMISFIGFVTWLIFVLRFNVFKRFGEYKTGNGIKTFALFFTAIFFIVLPNYMPLIVESWKANMKYTGDELVRDANRINELIVMKHKNMIPQDWRVDSFKVLPDKDKRLLDPYSTTTTVVTTDSAAEILPLTNEYTFVTKEDMMGRLAVADSLIKMTDTTYAIYQCPRLNFVVASGARQYSSEKFLSSKGLYDTVALSTARYDMRAVDTELQQLLAKYNSGIESFYYNDNATDFNAVLDKKYSLYTTNDSIDNIADKKYTFHKEYSVYIRVIFYISFCLGLLLFIFRHSTVKTFFLTVLTVVLLLILNGLFLAVSNSNELGILGAMLFNFFIILIVMIVTTNAKSRTLAAGISLNIVTAFTAFVPMIAVLYYYEMLSTRYTEGYHYYEGMKESLQVAEVAGILLLIVLLEPVFKKLYRKWYALPEN